MKCFLAAAFWFSLVWTPLYAATTDAEILRIQSDIQAGNIASAEHALNAAMKADPRNGGLYNLRGIIEANRNQMTSAEMSFGRAIDLSPNLIGAYLNFGRTCEILGERDPAALDRAIRRFRSLLATQPGANEVRVQLAKLLTKQKQYSASLSELDQLPVDVRAGELAQSLRKENLHQLIASYQQREQWAEARKEAEALALLEPKQTAPLLELARIAQRQNDLRGALGYLAHARTLEPESAPVHFFFGVVCIELDLPLEAKKSLDKALAIEPNNPTYNYARGSVELQGNSAWLAIPYFKKFIASEPGNARGHFALGAAEFASHDYEAAAKELNSIVGCPETEAGVQYFLGRIAKVNSDWALAAEHLAKSTAADPNYAESHAELGLAKMHLGDLAGSRAEIDRAIQLNPDSYLANSNLLALYQKTKDPHLPDQQQRLRELYSKRSQKRDLMVRTIRVEP